MEVAPRPVIQQSTRLIVERSKARVDATPLTISAIAEFTLTLGLHHRTGTMRLHYFALLWLLADRDVVDGSRISNDGDTIDDASSRRKLSTMDDLFGSLDAASSAIDNKLFLYKTPSFQWVPSSVYRYDDFRAGLEVMASDGVAGKKYYIGEDVENGYIYGLVNIAAFLAQSMKETIQVRGLYRIP